MHNPIDVLAGDAIYSASLRVPASPGLLTVTVVAAATNKIGATNVVTYTIVPPPSNDNFVNATKVPAEGGFILSNNRFATIETNEPFHGGLTTVAASLWWAWSPTGNTNVLVDATGSAIDAVVAVYTGNDLTRLQPVAAAVGSVAQKKTAHVSFNAQAGVAYQIAVALHRHPVWSSGQFAGLDSIADCAGGTTGRESAEHFHRQSFQRCLGEQQSDFHQRNGLRFRA